MGASLSGLKIKYNPSLDLQALLGGGAIHLELEGGFFSFFLQWWYKSGSGRLARSEKEERGSSIKINMLSVFRREFFMFLRHAAFALKNFGGGGVIFLRPSHSNGLGTGIDKLDSGV